MNIRKKCTGTAALMALTAVFGGCVAPQRHLDTFKPDPSPITVHPSHQQRPNFITIVLDDMGFSDLGVFGSEIPTPNMDQLAKNGIMLTNFYAAPTSTPSRAMLFTGKDSHVAGVGIMASMTPKPEQKGKREYQGRLSLDVPTFPELLQQNGYHTMFTGKWDLAGNTNIITAYLDSKNPKKLAANFGIDSLQKIQQQIWEIQEYDPIHRGFSVTRAALLPGGGYHYSGTLKDGNWELNKTPWELQSSKITPNLLYTENGLGLKEFSKEFYSTEYYTDMGVDMLKNRDKNKPFYLCMTYTAPHTPLQFIPQGLIEHYMSIYEKGWDVLREERFARQKQLGLWPDDAKLPPVPRKWSALNKQEQKMAAKRMAVYAAMMDILDRNIGKLIKHLKETGEYENTVIFLHSDNGGAADSIDTTPEIESDDSYENTGNPNSYVGVGDEDKKFANVKGQEWAMAMNTPFNTIKGSTNEGGWHTAAIAHYPQSKVKGVRNGRVTSVMDIAPTILEMADVTYPAHYKGEVNQPTKGISMADMFQGNLSGFDDRFVAFEMNGKIGVRCGDWKLVKECTKNAQLFDLQKDPFELTDVASEHPETLRELKCKYRQYADENGIVEVKSETKNGQTTACPSLFQDLTCN